MREIEQRTRETDNEILRVRKRRQRIESEIALIEKETEQLRAENARLRTLLFCVDQLCFPPESSSYPPAGTEPGLRHSSP